MDVTSAAVTPYLKPWAASALGAASATSMPANTSATGTVLRIRDSPPQRLNGLRNIQAAPLRHPPVEVLAQPSCARALLTYAANAGFFANAPPSKRSSPAKRKIPVPTSEERT